MTQLVYVTQVDHNLNIKHFVDAILLPVTTLTTTGFGDHTSMAPQEKPFQSSLWFLECPFLSGLFKQSSAPHKVRFNCNRTQDAVKRFNIPKILMKVGITMSRDITAKTQDLTKCFQETPSHPQHVLFQRGNNQSWSNCALLYYRSKVTETTTRS